MATVEQYRTAKAMLAYALQHVERASNAVHVFGAPLSSYREARKNCEEANALLLRVTAELPADVLAAEHDRIGREEALELEVTSEFENSVCISRGLDSVWMTTEEAERLLAELPNAIKMSR